jgi:hypothetical protein
VVNRFAALLDLGLRLITLGKIGINRAAGRGQVRPPAWHLAMDQKPPVAARVSGLSWEEAEDLLDWLEAHGIHSAQVAHVIGEGFSVWYGQES